MLAGCTEDLSDYYNRLDDLEAASNLQRDKNANLKKLLEQQDSLNALILQRQQDQLRWNEELLKLINGQETLISEQGGQIVLNQSVVNEQDNEVSRLDSIITAQGEQISALIDYGNSLMESTISQGETNGSLLLTWEALQQRLDSLETALATSVKPRLLSMEFSPVDNPTLQERAVCKVNDDNTIDCWLPNVTTDKILVPRFTFEGTLVTISSMECQSGVTRFDFSRPLVLTVATSTKIEWYLVYVHAYTGLPILYINTDGRQAVTSKDYYLNGSMRLVEDVKTRAAGDVTEARVHIKGRGNSSWKQPKKPYRLKFDEKISMLGEPADKSWVLIPNYNDKSMLCNSLAFYMSSVSNLDYTPRSHFVELVLNGSFDGTYLLCEKVKVSNHRLAVGDDGFLLEVDARAPSENKDPYFETEKLENPVVIKEPEVAYYDDNFNYARNYITQCENILFSSGFKNATAGWQKYLDMDSFVDWYLIQEIGKNIDGLFWSSCYMHLQRGGKLMMGPIWDMDVAFGNIEQQNQTCYDPTGFYIRNVYWYYRLYQDPAFVQRVKERFNFFYNKRYEFLRDINADAQYLRYSAVENEKRWGTLYHWTWSNYDIWGNYQNEVQRLKTWFLERMEWMKKQYDKM